MRKKILTDGAFILAFILSVVYLVFTIKGWDIKDIISKDKTPIGMEKHTGSVRMYTNLEVADYMHQLANSLIIAEDDEIWGVKPMTKNNIEKAFKMATNAPSSEHNKIMLKIISNWQKCDFSNIVEDHNVVWKMLGGTIGKASKPDIEAVARAVENSK